MNDPRDHNKEYQDLEDRKYAYDFDYLMHEYMLRAFRPLFSGPRVLELGCYEGEFTRRLSREFERVTVVEAASDLIETARAANAPDVRFVHGRFESVSLDERFDAIFLTHTLEHLDDPQAVLRRIPSWLAEGGSLFLVVPNANAASRQIAVQMGLIEHNQAVTDGEHRHGHRKTYALDTLTAEVRAAGLAPISTGGIVFKALANFQLDRALRAGIIDQAYLDGCYALGERYPDLCASIYAVCRATED